MKTALLLTVLASPIAAQDYAIQDSDTVPTQLQLSDAILDRDLEYFDGGISRYAIDGSYAWTYAENNGGTVHTGIHNIQQQGQNPGVVCVTYDTGQNRCDMFVISNERLVLLTNDGQRYPLRDIR